ncbi:hypothetical protein KUCAC02_034151, partial [Chaenocephalus aceratus]
PPSQPPVREPEQRRAREAGDGESSRVDNSPRRKVEETFGAGLRAEGRREGVPQSRRRRRARPHNSNIKRKRFLCEEHKSNFFHVPAGIRCDLVPLAPQLNLIDPNARQEATQSGAAVYPATY